MKWKLFNLTSNQNYCQVSTDLEKLHLHCQVICSWCKKKPIFIKFSRACEKAYRTHS